MPNDLLSVRGPANEPDEKAQDTYRERLLRLIPGETVSLYAVSTGLITNQVPEDARFVAFVIVFVACLGLTALIRFGEALDPVTKKPQWWNMGVACVSFVIYAYTLGGLFQVSPRYVPPGWNPVYGTLASGFWTVALPYLYRAK